MPIRTHKFITLLLAIVGALAGAYLVRFFSVIIQIYYYNPVKSLTTAMILFSVLPLVLGGYCGAYLLPRIFGALVPARCPRCGVATRTYSEGFGAPRPLFNYTCAHCENNPESPTAH
jgi:hypothetical protein